MPKGHDAYSQTSHEEPKNVRGDANHYQQVCPDGGSDPRHKGCKEGQELESLRSSETSRRGSMTALLQMWNGHVITGPSLGPGWASMRVSWMEFAFSTFKESARLRTAISCKASPMKY
jgi:hypothetical protein